MDRIEKPVEKIEEEMVSQEVMAEGEHEEHYPEPPGILCKLCCPPCAVVMHEGPGLPCCLAFVCGCWYTVFCWSPKQGLK